MGLLYKSKSQVPLSQNRLVNAKRAGHNPLFSTTRSVTGRNLEIPHTGREANEFVWVPNDNDVWGLSMTNDAGSFGDRCGVWWATNGHLERPASAEVNDVPVCVVPSELHVGETCCWRWIVDCHGNWPSLYGFTPSRYEPTPSSWKVIVADLVVNTALSSSVIVPPSG